MSEREDGFRVVEDGEGVDDSLSQDFMDEVLRHAPDLGVVESECPVCGSREIGYNLMSKEWDCHACGHVWPGVLRDDLVEEE